MILFVLFFLEGCQGENSQLSLGRHRASLSRNESTVAYFCREGVICLAAGVLSERDSNRQTWTVLLLSGLGWAQPLDTRCTHRAFFASLFGRSWVDPLSDRRVDVFGAKLNFWVSEYVLCTGLLRGGGGGGVNYLTDFFDKFRKLKIEICARHGEEIPFPGLTLDPHVLSAPRSLFAAAVGGVLMMLVGVFRTSRSPSTRSTLAPSAARTPPSVR